MLATHGSLLFQLIVLTLFERLFVFFPYLGDYLFNTTR